MSERLKKAGYITSGVLFAEATIDGIARYKNIPLIELTVQGWVIFSSLIIAYASHFYTPRQKNISGKDYNSPPPEGPDHSGPEPKITDEQLRDLLETERLEELVRQG